MTVLLGGGGLQSEGRNPVDAGWTHTLKVTSPGTRSEGLREDLLYRGKSVPSGIERLYALGYVWEFRTSTDAWKPSGWRITVVDPMVESVDEPLGAGDLKEAMAPSPWLVRKASIPRAWVQVAHGNEAWWVDPGRLEDLVARRGWSTPTNPGLRSPTTVVVPQRP